MFGLTLVDHLLDTREFLVGTHVGERQQQGTVKAGHEEIMPSSLSSSGGLIERQSKLFEVEREKQENSKNSRFLDPSDAVSAGIGVFVGLSLFANSWADLFFGFTTFLLLLAALSTQKALDLDYQYALYIVHSSRKVNHVVHMLCIWPIVCATMVICASQSSWCTALCVFYSFFYLAADRSFVGLLGAILMVIAYAMAQHFARTYDNALYSAVQMQLLFCAILFSAHISVEGVGRAVHVLRLIYHHPLLVVLISPLFAILELFICLGFRKEFAERARENAQRLCQGAKI